MRIGLCGGSFDPIHFGHIGLARQAFRELNLDRVIFIPTKKQPFKLAANPASAEDRVNMLKLALENEKMFSISSLEIERDGISYTFDTLQQIKQILDKAGGSNEYYFIMGGDSFSQIESWHKAELLLSSCNLAVGIRPGTDMGILDILRLSIEEKYSIKIVFLNNKQLEISSTIIKDKLRKGESIKGLLPEKTRRYIYERKLYR